MKRLHTYLVVGLWSASFFIAATACASGKMPLASEAPLRGKLKTAITVDLEMYRRRHGDTALLSTSWYTMFFRSQSLLAVPSALRKEAIVASSLRHFSTFSAIAHSLRASMTMEEEGSGFDLGKKHLKGTGSWRQSIYMDRLTLTRVLPSLGSRILLLALLVCVLLAFALTGFFLLLRQTQSTIIGGAASRLLTVTNSFARDFLNATDSSNNRPAQRALTQDSGPHADGLLAAYSVAAFRGDPGVEGGFYSASTDSLLGYAFPTQDGPGPKNDIPPRERPTILSVAQQAVQTGKPAAFTFRGQKDVILFQAVPLVKNNQTLGSVWAMHRIHDVGSGRDIRALFGISCLGLAAMACVGVAFWITRNVQADVLTIQGRLHDLETDLRQPRRSDVSASELHGILSGIDNLGISLQQKIEEERRLVEQLHHKERLAALGQVAAGVAHELRNPLATIRLRAQMSMRSKDPEQLDRSAKLTLEEIDRLSGVLDRLLYFAKPIQLQLTYVNPAQLCEDLLASLQPEAEGAGISFQLTRSKDTEIRADALKLRQVLENLVRNSMESFEETTSLQKKILVSVDTTSSSVHIRVKDNGSGVPDKVLNQVFDPFFTTKARGTGLGLSIANEIVRAHEGTLTLDTLADGGAIAEMVLPLNDGQPHRGQAEQKDEEAE
jgi:signal transduction histidine kinase